jgi:flagellar motility protein MotE (MotC chaperone)
MAQASEPRLSSPVSTVNIAAASQLSQAASRMPSLRQHLTAMPKFRLVPLTMFVCILFLGIKVGDIIRGGKDLMEARLIAQATAQEAPPAANEKNAPTEKTAASNAGDEKKPTGDKAEKKDGKEGAGDTSAADTAENGKKADGPAREFTQTELDVLQSLSERRKQLEKWEEDIKLKEELLKATELRITSKIDEMKKLRGELEKKLVTYNEQEDVQINSLVKIYENMKPKDAARIFEELDMPILLQVVDKMKEKKAAPILANMDPARAKQVTVEMAEMQKIFREASEQASPAAAPAGAPPRQ